MTVKQLVERWRAKADKLPPEYIEEIALLRMCADELSAILKDSSVEPERQGHD